MTKLIALILIMFLIFFDQNVAFASNNKDFSAYMEDWTTKKELASKLLLEAENAYKSGDELSACALQSQASDFGIEATESLIKAMEINGSTDGLENLEVGLNKWKELGRLC